MEITSLRRDRLIYYVPCPEDQHHYILADPTSPLYERHPPQSPMVTECRGCGEHYRVTVTQPWRRGYVSDAERDQLLARAEPERE